MKSNRLVASFASFAPLLWAVLYFALGYFSYALNGYHVATGYIWLPAGVTVSALLLLPTARWFSLLVLLVAAQMLLGWIEQRELWRIALLALNEIGMAALVAGLVKRRQLPLVGLHFVRALLTIAASASLISALIGAAWYATNQNAPFWPTVRVWALSYVVGILIVTPLLVAWSSSNTTRRGGIARIEWMWGLLALLGVLVSAFLAFGSEIAFLLLDISFSSTYLPLFFIALAALLLGERGGTLSVAALALIAFAYNSLGRGPFAELVQLHSSNALLELQVYLAMASLLSLLIGALKTTREQLHEHVALRHDEVEMALSASRQLIYSIDPHELKMSWSGDVEAELGLARQQLSTLAQVLALVHPLDQARLRQRWLDLDDEEEQAGGARKHMPVRLQLDGGRSLAVTDMSRSLRDKTGKLTSIAGVWHLSSATPPLERLSGDCY